LNMAKQVCIDQELVDRAEAAVEALSSVRCKIVTAESGTAGLIAASLSQTKKARSDSPGTHEVRLRHSLRRGPSRP
jgi:hypothetical protein